MSDCHDNIREASGKNLPDAEINRLLAQVDNAAREHAKKTGQDYEAALKDIAGEVAANEGAMKALSQRQTLLNISAKRKLKDFAMRFDTPGEGIQAFLVGSPKKVTGARDSVDYRAKSTHQRYFGRLVVELEQAGVLKDFMSGDLDRAIYTEMGELREGGTPGASGSKAAMEIAKVIEGVTDEMVSRQNRAGAYIQRLPGYVVRQTHDRGAIRAAGGEGIGKGSKKASLKAWYAFTRPLLDPVKTFQGANPSLFMRRVHEGLYTGVHGEAAAEAEIVTGFSLNIGRKASAERILHFKDADAAYRYNQEFGLKNLRDSLFSDIFFRSRNIALLEALGPNPEAVLQKAVRELGEESRMSDRAGELVDSLNDWRIMAAFNTVSGKNDLPKSYSLSTAANTVRSLMTLSRMGATVISAITDKGFFQTEMAFQGIDALKTMGKQIVLFAGHSKEQTQMLRLMGVGLDGLIGNTVSRYTIHTSVAGVGHRLQQKLFDINFLNWWTDIHKGAAAELMAAHLGEHSHVPFEKLPGELSNVLSLYNISRSQWDALRSTAWALEGAEHKVITPDKVAEIPEATIKSLLQEQGLTPSEANQARMRDNLETSLRTYIADRVDYAIPTPGAATKQYTTMNTQAGTPLGEAVRMLMLFKSFPLAVLQKVVARDVYGQGANSIKSWLLHDSKGKFRMMQTVAMTTMLGYLSGVIRDALKGKTPKEITTDGKINFDVLQEAMLRGGGAGIMADLLFSEYDGSAKDFLSQQSGPFYGGVVNPLMAVLGNAKNGKFDSQNFRKVTLDNTPFINLFYTRPVLDYLLLWNLQEMTDPGSLERMEQAVEKRGRQHYFVRPSER